MEEVCRLDLEHVVAEGDDVSDNFHLQPLSELQEGVLLPLRVLPRIHLLELASR